MKDTIRVHDTQKQARPANGRLESNPADASANKTYQRNRVARRRFNAGSAWGHL